MVYSLTKQQNEEIIEKFLKMERRASYYPFDGVNLSFENSKGFIKIHPKLHQMTGFFIARLTKRNEQQELEELSPQ